MTDNLPMHLRISGLVPSNDDVTSRRAAISALAATWRKITDVNKILVKSASIARCVGGEGQPPAEIGREVESAVQKHAAAFLYEDRPFEVGVCAGVAALAVLKMDAGTSGWSIRDVYSNALWSALSFQAPLAQAGRETLRREVLDTARTQSLQSADAARARVPVPNPVDLEVTVAEGAASTNFKKAAMGAIEALIRNATLDREEIDFLWWSQVNRSQILDRTLSSIPELTRAVALGVEAAGKLRRYPADVHRELVLRTIVDDDASDLAEVIQELGPNREIIVRGVNMARVEAHPDVFPLLAALGSGMSTSEGAGQKRPVSEWGARALLEASLANMSGIVTK